MEERISDIEDRNLEMIQREEERDPNIKKKERRKERKKELYENYLTPKEKAI